MANYLYTITIPQRGIIENGFHHPIYKQESRTSKTTGVIQPRRAKYSLTAKHMIILDSIENMILHWSDINKLEVDGKTYYNIAYAKIISENPFIKISKTRLFHSLKTLEIFGLLKLKDPDYSLNRTYMRLGDKNYLLHYFDPSVNK